MNLFKQLFRKMNLDSDVRTQKPGDYRILRNGISVQPGAGSKSLMDVISNLYGNALVSNSLPSGTNTAIGFKQDRVGNRAFFFVANSTASNNSIYQYKNGAITLVLRNAVLDFLATDVIEADIVGDILFWTNGRTEIQRIDVVKAIAGGTYTPSATELALSKKAPRLPVTFVLGYDYTRQLNLMEGNYFQFYCRYQYELNDYSVFSPCSKTTNSWVNPNTSPTITVDYVAPKAMTSPLTGTAGYNPDGNSVYGGVTAGQKILLTSQTNPIENGLWVVNAGAWTRDVSLPAAAVVNSNLTVFVLNGDIYARTSWKFLAPSGAVVGTDGLFFVEVQGPNFATITQGETTPSIVKKREFAVRINGSNEFIVYRIELAGAYSTTHTFYNDINLFTVPDAETFVFSDAIPLKSRSLNLFKNRIFLFNNTEGYDHTTTTSLTLTTSDINPFPAVKSFNSFLSGGVYSVGIVFFDGFDRTSGVKCENKITIPEADNGFYKKILVNTTPVSGDVPSWATHFRLCMTKCQNISYFVSCITLDIYHFTKSSSGVYTFNKLDLNFRPEGAAIDITPLTLQGLGYTWSKGDRIKVYYVPQGSSFQSVIDTEILSQDGRFLITRPLFELPFNGSGAQIRTPITIYTPKIFDQTYYEIGETYPVASIGTTYTLEGDVEAIKSYQYEKQGAYSKTDPYTNESVKFTFGFVQAMNMWSKNYNTWVTQAGRGLVKSDSRQIAKTTYLRHSEQFIQNSNVLGLNTFYALNEYALPVENGPGVSIVEAGQVMVAVSEAETSRVYVGEGFVSTGSSAFLTKTDSVIGDDQRYQGGHGSIHPRSIVSRDSRVYFLDARKGVIVRRSQDGLTVISQYGVKGLVSNLCETHIALGLDSRIVAGWDPQYDCYVISFVKISDNSGYTLYFHEPTNSWVCQADIKPTLWGLLEQKQIAFLGGQFWIQTPEANFNNWFGTQYNRTLEFEIAPGQSMECIWNAIEVDVETLFTTAGTNEDIVLLYHVRGGQLQTKINYLDFVKRASAYRSSFFRNINDASFGSVTESKYKSPDAIRGQSAYITIVSNVTGYNSMKSISIFYTPSLQSFQ